MLKNQYNLYLKTASNRVSLTIEPTPADASVRFSLDINKTTELTVTSNNPNLVIENNYTGTMPNQGLAITYLYYYGAIPAISYNSSFIECTNDGVLSGFTNSENSKVSAINYINIGTGSWEINEKITTGIVTSTDNKIILRLSDTNNTSNVLSLFYKHYDDTDNISFGFSLGTGSSNTYDIVSDIHSDTFNVQSNTTYNVKLAYDGLNYTLSVSTDGINYTTLCTYQDSTKIASNCNYNTIAYIGSGDENFNYAFTNGIVDLRETNIKSNNQIQWDGIYQYKWHDGLNFVNLSDYDIELVSGVPQTNDVITLSYYTTREFPYTGRNKITVPVDTVVFYEVYKPGYATVRGSILLTEDTTIPITIYPGVDLEDYIYELTNNDLDMGAING